MTGQEPAVPEAAPQLEVQEPEASVRSPSSTRASPETDVSPRLTLTARPGAAPGWTVMESTWQTANIGLTALNNVQWQSLSNPAPVPAPHSR